MIALFKPSIDDDLSLLLVENHLAFSSFSSVVPWCDIGRSVRHSDDVWAIAKRNFAATGNALQFSPCSVCDAPVFVCSHGISEISGDSF